MLQSRPPGRPGITPDLRATFDRACALMAEAQHPWFIIGSAAAALVGLLDQAVADVDILAEPADTLSLAERLGLPIPRPAPSERFRSDRLVKVYGAPLPIEIMANFQVRTPHGWMPVAVGSTVALPWGEGRLLIPTAREQARICRLFGRPKDLRRAHALEAIAEGPR